MKRIEHRYVKGDSMRTHFFYLGLIALASIVLIYENSVYF